MKVLIVGAGIAGPTLAYWLLRSGHEATLVERAPELRRGGYLVDFWGAGFDVAERMGIVPELRRRGYVFTEARAVDRDGRRMASVKPSAIMGRTQRYVSIARSDLAAVIYEALGGRAELILDDTVDALVDDDGERVRVPSRAAGSATSIWSSVPTACTPGCGGWYSDRTSSSRSTWASSSRPSRRRDTARATN